MQDFFVKSGVRKDCLRTSPHLVTTIDLVMLSTVKTTRISSEPCCSILRNLLVSLWYYDLALWSHIRLHMQEKISRLQQNISNIGLKIIMNKTEVVALNMTPPQKIRLDGKNLATLDENFHSLGESIDFQQMVGQKRRTSQQDLPSSTFSTSWSTSISRNTNIRIYNTCSYQNRIF